MLYRTLKRVIERGNTAGMLEKLNTFRTAGSITSDEYAELVNLLAQSVSKG